MMVRGYYVIPILSSITEIKEHTEVTVKHDMCFISFVYSATDTMKNIQYTHPFCPKENNFMMT